MAREKIEALVEGGKATAAPPLGPALGPMGVNIGQVVAEINKKTASFAGMQVPVKVFIDKSTKEFNIEIGTPPASALLKKEAGIEKGSGSPKKDKVADIYIEQIIKVAKMKEDALLGKTLKDRVKEIIGTCNSMGIMIEGKAAVDAISDVNSGIFDEEIRLEKIELTAEEKAKLEEKKKKLAEEIEKRRAEHEKVAKEIIASMSGAEKGAIKAKLTAAGVPDDMIKALMPAETAAAGDAGKQAAEGKAEEKKEDKK